MIDFHERSLIRLFCDRLKHERARQRPSDEGRIAVRESDVMRAEYFIDLLLTELSEAEKSGKPAA